MADTQSPSEGKPIHKLLVQQELIKIIVNALTETIKKYTQTAVTPGAASLKAKTASSDAAVAGVIRFEGKEFSLELFLGFSKELFLTMYENMFPMPVNEISAENHDLAGEILNIAFGEMDPKFRKMNLWFHSSFCKVYSGKALIDFQKNIKAEAISIPYATTDGKRFVAELYCANSIPVSWEYDPGKKKY